jgi:hypothetical protein
VAQLPNTFKRPLLDLVVPLGQFMVPLTEFLALLMEYMVLLIEMIPSVWYDRRGAMSKSTLPV